MRQTNDRVDDVVHEEVDDRFYVKKNRIGAMNGAIIMERMDEICAKMTEIPSMQRSLEYFPNTIKPLNQSYNPSIHPFSDKKEQCIMTQ